MLPRMKPWLLIGTVGQKIRNYNFNQQTVLQEYGYVIRLHASGIAVLGLELRGIVGAGVVGAVVVADGEVGVAGAQAVVVVAGALRGASLLLRNADVEDAVGDHESVSVYKQ